MIRDHDSTASMLAEIVCASLREAGREPDEAAALLAAVEAAPEFDRLWQAGRKTAVGVGWQDGRLLIEVSDGGPSEGVGS